MNGRNGERREGDGIEKDASGFIASLTCHGKKYVLTPLQESDFRDIENYLIQTRYSPLEAIAPELEKAKDNPRLYDALVDRAYRDMRNKADTDRISATEVREFLDTREGTVRTIWLMLRRNYPEITLEKAAEMFSHVATAEMQRQRDTANADFIRTHTPRALNERQTLPGPENEAGPAPPVPDAADAKPGTKAGKPRG